MFNMTIQIKRRSEDYDEQAVSVLGYTFFFSAGTYCAKAIAIGLGLSAFAQMASALVYLGWFFVLFRVLIQNYNLIVKVVFAEIIYFVFVLLNINIFPNTETIFNEYIMFIRQIAVVYIPCGVVCSQISSFSEIFEKLRTYGYLGVYMMVIAYLLGYARVHGHQYLGVQITPFVLILFVEFCKKKIFSNIIALSLSLLLILVGDRQSLLVVGISMLMIYIFINKKNTKKIVMASLATLLFLLIFYMFFEQILNLLISIFVNAGMNTKIFSTLLEGEFLSTSSRDIIYETCINVIQSKGAQYTGVFSGIYYVRSVGSNWMVYPHNMILEILMDFGTVIGTLLLLLLLIMIIKNCLMGSDDRRLFMICLSLMAIVRLMVSSSYLIEGNFYVLLIILLMGHNDVPSKLRFRRIQ